VQKSFHSGTNKAIFGLALPILFVAFFSLSGCTPVGQDVDDQRQGASTSSPEIITTDAPKPDAMQEAKPESQEEAKPESQEEAKPESQEGTQPDSQEEAKPESQEENVKGAWIPVVQVFLTLVFILILVWLLYDFWKKKPAKLAPVDRPGNPRGKDHLGGFSPKSKPPRPGGVPKVDGLKAGSKSPVIKQEPEVSQPPTVRAKVERPVLSTVSEGTTTEVRLPNTQTADDPLVPSTPGAIEPVLDKAIVEVEEKQIVQVQERLNIKPPQIGEPSSFAKHDWWDKDREWCQVSPHGMSSDVVCDIGTFGAVAIAAASLRGHKHKVSGEPCQDAFSLRATQSMAGQKYVVAVLCDGMSSAKHSEYGARRTSQLLAWSLAAMVEDQEEITEQRVKSTLPEIFEYCKQNLMPQKRNQFGASGILPKAVVESDFFTTVTFMIVPASSGEGENFEVIVGSIGDSAVFVLDNSTSLWKEVAAADSSSEILNPATSAFPATFDARISTIFVKKSDLVIATSDGVGNYINVRGNQTSLGTYLARQWGKPVNLPTFINDVGFDLKSADDDRTVVAIWLSRS